jgi:hypothetical protein
MKYNPEKHHRRSIRLKGYDYTSSGAYFITICTHQRECLFGEIVDGGMRLNAIGFAIQAYWQRLPLHFAVGLDAFIVMPNHIHGILILTDTPCRGAACGQDSSDHGNAFLPNATPNPMQPLQDSEPGVAFGRGRSGDGNDGLPHAAPLQDSEPGVAFGRGRSGDGNDGLPHAAPTGFRTRRGIRAGAIG